MKQETLEEATILAWDLYEHTEGHLYSTTFKNAFKLGAKWQAERMFKIMDAYTDDVMGGCNLRAKEWFEQFKNK